MKKLLAFAFTAVCALALSAQNQYEFPQETTPSGMDNHLFSACYYNGGKVYNLRGAELSSGGTVGMVKMDPTGSSFATIETKGGKATVVVHDMWKAHHTLAKITNGSAHPTAIAYSPDARSLAVAWDSKEVVIYGTADYQPAKRFTATAPASEMVISSNNYFIALCNQDGVEVWNPEKGTKRQSVRISATPHCVAFADDNKKMLVTASDECMYVYDTADFKQESKIDALGTAGACDAHHEGKYAAVVSGDNMITLVNLLNPKDREFIRNSNGGIANVSFVRSSKDKSYVAYNTNRSVVYAPVDLRPYYGKMMSDELSTKMKQWLQRMPGESELEYTNRVNDATRDEQEKLFQQEIATRMVTGTLEKTDITIGKYDRPTQTLSLGFQSMPEIGLLVPESDLAAFGDPSQVEVRNARYALGEDDELKLVYAEFHNKVNNKTYTFSDGNMLMSSGTLASTAIMSKATASAAGLQSIRDDVMAAAKRQNIVSDHTHINVSADAVPTTDADGKQVVNMNVSFSYDVDKAFSAKDDFAPGRYDVNESGAASTMLEVMKKAFESDFAKYATAGKKVIVKVKGTADATPINRTITYSGRYGQYNREPVQNGTSMEAITLKKAEGISSNEQLAFARALSVKNYVQKNISALNKMDAKYEYQTEVSTKTGGEYRRITVEYIFVDAF